MNGQHVLINEFPSQVANVQKATSAAMRRQKKNLSRVLELESSPLNDILDNKHVSVNERLSIHNSQRMVLLKCVSEVDVRTKSVVAEK